MCGCCELGWPNAAGPPEAQAPKQAAKRRSGMNVIELRRKLRGCDKGGLFFRLLTR